MSDFRKPRPDVSILPQSAIYRKTPTTPFKVPKGRRGRKPKGQKLIPKTLSQFNKFHTEAARNKERDRAEQARIDAIRERDEARRERTERLAIEDRRYAIKTIVDARERAAERDFRREQLRLLRQQAAAPPPALPPPPNINIAPAPINIQQPDIQVRPVINLPAGQQGALPAAGGGDYREARERAREFAAFREQLQADIRRGFAEGARQLGLGQEERRRPPEVVILPPPPTPPQGQPTGRPRSGGGRPAGVPDPTDPEYLAQVQRDRAEALAYNRAEAQRERDEAIAAERQRARREREEAVAQAERDRQAALEAVEQATQEAQQVRQREAEALRVAVERQREAQGLQTQLQALEAREARRLEEAEGARGQAEQELTQQLSRAQRARNQAEDRARELQARAEELERHNQTLQQQRRPPEQVAPLRDGSQFETQQDRDDEIAERFSEQYRDIILRQSTREQREDPEFLRRLGEFQDRVEETYRLPYLREGEDIADEDRPFHINPFRPENERFLREQLAEERIIRGGLSQLRSDEGIRGQVRITQEQIDQEIETIQRLEREEQRRRLGRGEAQPPNLRGFSSEDSDEEIDLGLGPPRIDPLTQSQFDRDFDEIQRAQAPVDYTLRFDEEEAERQARGDSGAIATPIPERPTPPPRPQTKPSRRSYTVEATIAEGSDESFGVGTSEEEELQEEARRRQRLDRVTKVAGGRPESAGRLKEGGQPLETSEGVELRGYGEGDYDLIKRRYPKPEGQREGPERRSGRKFEKGLPPLREDLRRARRQSDPAEAPPELTPSKVSEFGRLKFAFGNPDIIEAQLAKTRNQPPQSAPPQVPEPELVDVSLEPDEESEPIGRQPPQRPPPERGGGRKVFEEDEGLTPATELGKEQGFYRELAQGQGVPAGGEYVVGMSGKNYARTFRKKDFNWATDVMNGDFQGENLYQTGLDTQNARGTGLPTGYNKSIWDKKQEQAIPFELVLNEDLDNSWASGRRTRNLPTKKGSYKFRTHGKRGVSGNSGLFNFFHQRGDIGEFGTKEGTGNAPDFTIDLHRNSDRIERLVQEGKISFRDTGADLQLPEPEEPSLLGQAAGAVGGAVATGAGVVGNAALGAARGVGGAVYERLPSAGDIGEVAGRGAVAVGSGLVGAVRGVYQAATSPRVGEQTGGTLGTDAQGRRIVGLGQTDEI